MQRTGKSERWTYSFVAVATALLLTGCSETSGTGPGRGFPEIEIGRDSSGAQVTIGDDTPGREPDLGACTNIALREPSALTAHAYATGDQIYRWTGTNWVFVAPVANLYADAGAQGQIGTHYVGPTWESNSGSKVVGTVVDRCPADPNSIPWLLLRAVSAEGPGIFQRVTFIHRVNTVGGNMPSAPGSYVGELANVPYTAEYYFYRAH
jgi:hypothetical protein